MIAGHVDSNGRALIDVKLAHDEQSEFSKLSVWIDTGFTGQLVLPKPLIQQFGLRKASATHAQLADGTGCWLETYEATIDWLGERFIIEVIEGRGNFPLLGVLLLLGCRLAVDYSDLTVVIERRVPTSCE